MSGKLSDSKIEAIFNLYEQGKSAMMTAKTLGVARETVRHYLKQKAKLQCDIIARRERERTKTRIIKCSSGACFDCGYDRRKDW